MWYTIDFASQLNLLVTQCKLKSDFPMMSRDMVWGQGYQEQAWLNATHNFLKVLACSDVQSVKRSARVAEE